MFETYKFDAKIVFETFASYAKRFVVVTLFETIRFARELIPVK